MSGGNAALGCDFCSAGSYPRPGPKQPRGQQAPGRPEPGRWPNLATGLRRPAAGGDLRRPTAGGGLEAADRWGRPLPARSLFSWSLWAATCGNANNRSWKQRSWTRWSGGNGG